VKRDPSNYLVMTDGHIVRRSNKDEPAQIVAFDKYAVDLDRFEKKVTEKDDLKPRERYLSELLHPEPGSRRYQQEPGKFRAELHERTSNPLYPIAFSLIALAAVGQARSTRQNRIQQVTMAFVLAAALRLGGLALNNIVVLDANATVLLYALPLGAILVALGIIERNRRSLKKSRLERLLAGILEGSRAALRRLMQLVRPLPARPRSVGG